MPARIFLSYRRVPVDSQLAHALRGGLVKAGHEVFIDTDMPVGTNWVTTINDRIAQCDHFIVLLSPEAVSSEMVAAEVHQAYLRLESEAPPRLLPVWVKERSQLPYDFDAYLGRIQSEVCRDEADTARVLDRLLAVIGGGPSPMDDPVTSEPSATPVPTLRPLPVADMRPPGGTVRASDRFYVRRPQDGMIEAAAARVGGETILIRAPRQWGKSSLAIRYRDACRARGKACAYIDFQLLMDDILADRTRFLTEIMGHIRYELDLDFDLPETLSALSLTRLMQREVLPRTPGGLVLIFDEADVIVDRPYKRDFFAMLRGWHNRRAQDPDPWERLDLAVVIATEPWLLIDDPSQSPFNVATPLELEPFTPSQIIDLGIQHNLRLTEPEAGRLWALLGGQPYLTRLAFYRMLEGPGVSLSSIEQRATDMNGPFGEHLRSLLIRLGRRPELCLVDAMRQVERLGSVPDETTYERLAAAGLVRRDGKRVVPSNMLYARFFRALP